MTKLRTAMITALATLTVAGPTAGLAEAAPNNGGGGTTAKTCKFKDGTKAQPGDTMTHTRTTTVKGRRFVVRDTWICGEDGQWHPKA
jgi:hypothetical protein